MVKFELRSIAIGVLGASNHSLPNGWIEFRGGKGREGCRHLEEAFLGNPS